MCETGVRVDCQNEMKSLVLQSLTANCYDSTNE
jgi:hypothetical protein